MPSIKAIVEATTTAFTETLPRYGFESAPDRSSEGSFRRWWSRRRGWKTDVTEIVFRRGGELHLPINFLIWFGPHNGTRPLHSYSGLNIATPRIPQFFTDLRAAGYAARCLAAVTKEIEWFEQFRTPERCLDRLTAMTHGGPRKGGRIYDEMVAYLTGLVGGRNVQQCAPPNGVPATQLGNSGVTEGPPSES